MGVAEEHPKKLRCFLPPKGHKGLYCPVSYGLPIIAASSILHGNSTQGSCSLTERQLHLASSNSLAGRSRLGCQGAVLSCTSSSLPLVPPASHTPPKPHEPLAQSSQEKRKIGLDKDAASPGLFKLAGRQVQAGLAGGYSPPLDPQLVPPIPPSFPQASGTPKPPKPLAESSQVLGLPPEGVLLVVGLWGIPWGMALPP